MPCRSAKPETDRKPEAADHDEERCYGVRVTRRVAAGEADAIATGAHDAPSGKPQYETDKQTGHRNDKRKSDASCHDGRLRLSFPDWEWPALGASSHMSPKFLGGPKASRAEAGEQSVAFPYEPTPRLGKLREPHIRKA